VVVEDEPGCIFRFAYATDDGEIVGKVCVVEGRDGRDNRSPCRFSLEPMPCRSDRDRRSRGRVQLPLPDDLPNARWRRNQASDNRGRSGRPRVRRGAPLSEYRRISVSRSSASASQVLAISTSCSRCSLLVSLLRERATFFRVLAILRRPSWTMRSCDPMTPRDAHATCRWSAIPSQPLSSPLLVMTRRVGSCGSRAERSYR
jgi:hypothetical protein